MLFDVNYIAQGHAGDANLSTLLGHVAKWMEGISRFLREYNAIVRGSYGLGHVLGFLFAEIMPTIIGGRKAPHRVMREGCDLLCVAYDSMREIPKLTDTVPAHNRPNVNSLECPNTPISKGNPQSSAQVEAAHSNKNPERA